MKVFRVLINTFWETKSYIVVADNKDHAIEKVQSYFKRMRSHLAHGYYATTELKEELGNARGNNPNPKRQAG